MKCKVSAKLSILCGGILVLLTACPGFGDQSIEDLSPPIDAVPSWDENIEAILTVKCGGCHSVPSSGGAGTENMFRLDRYDRMAAGGVILGAFEKQGRIQDRIDKGTMPPSSAAQLSDEERLLVSKWLDNGAPKSASGGSTGPATWNGSVGALIAARCGSCHSEQAADPKIPDNFRLDVYDRAATGGMVDGAFEMRDRIDRRALIDNTMPPSGMLSLEEQVSINAWLTAGAPLD